LGPGWYQHHGVHLNEDGTFSYSLMLHPGENDFRLVGSFYAYKSGRVQIGITLKRTPAQIAADRAAAQRRAASKLAAETVHFTGNGGKNLGTVTIKRPSTLRWTCDGGIFQIFDDDGALFVNSQAANGTTAVDAGRFKHVIVNAIGNWTIAITPR
jgi:hypothetical protein